MPNTKGECAISVSQAAPNRTTKNIIESCSCLLNLHSLSNFLLLMVSYHGNFCFQPGLNVKDICYSAETFTYHGLHGLLNLLFTSWIFKITKATKITKKNMKDVTANQSEHTETLFKCAIANVFCLLYVCFVLIFLSHIVSVF